MLNLRDSSILEKIIEYCDQIGQTVQRFGNDYAIYCDDFVYRNACCMCILQIGELVGKLTEEFTASHAEIPWRSIKATRNLFAHAYGTVRKLHGKRFRKAFQNSKHIAKQFWLRKNLATSNYRATTKAVHEAF